MRYGPNAACGLVLVFFWAFGQPALIVSAVSSQGGPGETQAVANSFYNSARASLERADLDGAEKYFQQSLLISEKLAPASLAVARSLNGLGDVAQQRGNPPEAEAYYQKALAIIQRLDASASDAANSLDGLARVAYDRNDAAKFGEYAQRALSIRQKLDSNGLDFALSLNSMTGVYIERREWDRAKESSKNALTIEERLAPESLAVAETLTNLGKFFFVQRLYHEAELHHLHALAIRKKLAPDSLAVAESLRWLGLCARNDPGEQERYYRAALLIQEKVAPGSLHVARTLAWLSAAEQGRGDLLAAEDYARQALAIWTKLTPGSAQSRKLMVELVDILVVRGNLAGAEELARRAWEEDRKENSSGKYVGWDLVSLAKIAIRRGDLVTADDYYRQALEIGEKTDPDGLLPVRAMRGLAMIAEERGDLAKAEYFYRRTLAIWERTDPNSNLSAQGLFAVGIVLHNQGNLVQAEQYYRQALAIWERIVPDTLFVAQALGALGRLALDRGDLAGAEENQRRAIAIEQKSAPGGLALADGLSDLGAVLLARGALSDALQYHQQALAIREKLVPGTEDHATSLAALAGILRRQGKTDAAAQYYQQALDALANQAARLGGSDELRAGFRAKYAKYYKDYVDLLVEQKQLELAFQVIERFRARSLLETLAVARAEIRKGANPALVEQQRGLQQSLAARTQRRIELLGKKDHDAELSVLEKEIGDLHTQYQEVEERIRTSSPQYAALMQPQPVSAKQVQEQLLDADTALLEYSLGEERSYLLVLTRSTLSTYELPPRSNIEAVARAIYGFLTRQNEIQRQESAAQRQVRLERAQQAYGKQAAQLSRMVLEPAAGEIENKKRLLIVSDGALQYIPFAVLPIPRATTGGKEKPAVPLLMGHEIVNLPSASVWAELQGRPIERIKPSKEVAVLADPVFTKDDARVSPGLGRLGPADRRAGVARGQSTPRGQSIPWGPLARALADVPSARRGGAYLRRLPFSRREAQAILSLVPSPTMQALDFHANRATALSADLGQYRIVHFATHGFLDSEHPESSGLVFSLVNSRGHPEQGFMGLEDVYNMNLSADLVVLSACNTGLGKDIQGEGLVGLTQGFMYAGASQVVASLWSVDDAATAELMRRFYQAMEQKKMPPEAALRQAQIEIRQQKRWNHPYYWAGFVIHGQPK